MPRQSQDCSSEELDLIEKLMTILRSDNKKLIVAVTSYLEVMCDVVEKSGNVVSFGPHNPSQKVKFLLLGCWWSLCLVYWN